MKPNGVKKFSVVSLSKLAGVSERTLRYYDEIGLLVPSEKSGSGTRFYGTQELYRLQQVLFFRELGYPLNQIREILDDPGFELLDSLKNQRTALLEKKERTERLISTIDKTIAHMTSEKKELKVEDLYEGLSTKQMDEYRKEARERWGEEAVKSEERLLKMDKAQIKALKAEGDAIVNKMVSLMHLSPGDPLSQKTVGEYYRHLNQRNETPKERFRALGEMYVEDERFRAHYDQYAKGLATWLRDAIRIFTS